MYPWFKLSIGQLPLKPMQGAPLSTYLVLAAHQDQDRIAGMSYRALGDVTGFSRRSTIDAVRRLEHLGIIKRLNEAHTRQPLLVEILKGSRVGDGDPASAAAS